MCGVGHRFSCAGYVNAKPLIRLIDKTLIQWSVETLGIQGLYIFIILARNEEKLIPHLKTLKPDCKIIVINDVTRGTVDTILKAREFIDNNDPLITTNCDQILEWDSSTYVEALGDCDGNVLIFDADTDKNSYIELNSDGLGVRLAEKRVISRNSLVGVHYFRKGRYFVECGDELIARDIKENNEFYVSLVYNIMIEKGMKITAHKLVGNYYSIGTPEQMIEYLNFKGIGVDIHDIKIRGGWFIGNFEPSILNVKDFEVGYLKRRAGENCVHYHAKCTEYNYLIRGKMKVNGDTIHEGTMFTINKYMICIPEILEDCEIICVKIPSAPSDKVIL